MPSVKLALQQASTRRITVLLAPYRWYVCLRIRGYLLAFSNWGTEQAVLLTSRPQRLICRCSTWAPVHISSMSIHAFFSLFAFLKYEVATFRHGT